MTMVNITIFFFEIASAKSQQLLVITYLCYRGYGCNIGLKRAKNKKKMARF